MNKLVTSVFLFMFLLTPAFCSVDSLMGESHIDTAYIQVKQLDSSFFESYTNDQDFDYATEYKSIKNSFLDQLWRSIRAFFDKIQGAYKALTLLFRIGLWLVAIAILLFALFQFNLHRIFYSKKEHDPVDYVIESGVMLQKEYDEAIRKELEAKNFRKALRFHFIQTIHLLNEQKIIAFSKEKTNFDYLSEVKKSTSDLFVSFKSLVFVYNAVWYGHHEIDASSYKDLSSGFEHFKSQIHG